MRGGYSLIELLIVLALIGGILVIAINVMNPRGTYRISSLDDDLPFMKIFLDKYLKFALDASATVNDGSFDMTVDVGSFGDTVTMDIKFENSEKPLGLYMTAEGNRRFFKNVLILTNESTAGEYILLKFKTPGGDKTLFYPVILK